MLSKDEHALMKPFRKVIMVVIDGLKYDTAVEQMGYLHHLIEVNQAQLYKVISELPSLSRPLYEVLLTGTPCSINGITSNYMVRCSTQESIFSLTTKRGLRNAAAAYYWVSELYNRAPFHYIEDRFQENTQNNIQYGSFYFDDTYPDSHLFIDAENLRRRYDPHFLYIHSMGMDDIGHKFGSDSSEYRNHAGVVDTILAQLIPQWLEENYQILVTSDHGMNKDRNHGGTGKDEREVPLILINQQVQIDTFKEPIPQLLIAPLVCKLLEIPPALAMQKG